VILEFRLRDDSIRIGIDHREGLAVVAVGDLVTSELFKG